MKQVMTLVAFLVGATFVMGAGGLQARPFELSGMTRSQGAWLLRGLDEAAAAGAEAAPERLMRFASRHRKKLGRRVMAQLQELAADDPRGSKLAALCSERNALLIERRGSPLFRAVVVPPELSRPPGTALDEALWSGPTSLRLRQVLAEASGLAPADVQPGPALEAALRRALLSKLQGFGAMGVGRLRKTINEATHAIRGLHARVRLSELALQSAEAGNDGETFEEGWPWLRRNDALDQRILGALVYLDDTQIRDRLGRQTATIDASDAGDGASSKLTLNSAFRRRDLELPLPFDAAIRNGEGQWASFIHFAPKLWEKLSFSGRAKFSVQDSNLFTTAFCIHPLFLVEDETGIVDDMIDGAMSFIRSCKRGSAYAFWPRLPEDISPHDIIGPANTPYGPVALLGRLLRNPLVDGWLKKLPPKQRHMSYETLQQFMDPAINPAGAAAVVNIPADADDSSVAVAAQTLHAHRKGNMDDDAVDLGALEAMTRFRDLDRQKEEATDGWKGKDSGAYLTWIRDENEPTLSDPAQGYMPMEVNNVDSVVQANALFSLTLAGRQDLPGYEACRDLVARVAREKLWPGANLYYPQLMIFPYAASRAYRDAGARDPVMRQAMGRMLLDVLDLQIPDSERRLIPPRRPGGAFPGGPDRSLDLSTALACITLMNLGDDLAQEMGVGDRYREALRRGISFLLGQAQRYEIRDRATFAYGKQRPDAFVWSDGLFFSSGTGALAYWRSEPYTVATVLEALIKYRTGYDRHQAPMVASPRLRLLPPAGDGSASWRLSMSAPSSADRN